MRYQWPAVGAIGALVLLAAVVARGTSAVPVGQGRPLFEFLSLPRLEFLTAVGDNDQSSVAEPSGWVEVVGWVVLLLPLILLAGVIVAAVALSAISVRRRRRIGPATPVVPGEEVAGEVATRRLVRAAREAQEILAARQEGGEPSDAVIAAWVRLERAAADSSVRRRAHQTPTEFTDALLAHHESARTALDELRRLYQRARFATATTVGAAEAEAAHAALEVIVRSLSGEPVPT